MIYGPTLYMGPLHFILSFFHSFTHSFIHWLTDWLTHSFIYLYWYPCTINKLPKLSHRVPVHPTLKVILWLCSALMVVIVVFLQAFHIFLHVFFTFTCYNIYFMGITVVFQHAIIWTLHCHFSQNFHLPSWSKGKLPLSGGFAWNIFLLPGFITTRALNNGLKCSYIKISTSHWPPSLLLLLQLDSGILLKGTSRTNHVGCVNSRWQTIKLFPFSYQSWKMCEFSRLDLVGIWGEWISATQIRMAMGCCLQASIKTKVLCFWYILNMDVTLCRDDATRLTIVAYFLLWI